ncbi:bacillithiol biosynthesis deacetylase BshB2 [Bacillus massiliigorillae]|uniref:bacillithiol biosynthesis deacetylase BshB2 n=1 Tax=Bacillus massiliigorillae TaxID=1243664 RepID=UPI00039DA9CA|nr:bacillithiol biosynthesis deacetylase BshB2 [Bacillus massiliigorillae]
MSQESHVLVVFPHPDDEAFGVSGTIASFTTQGTPVTYMCLTLGEMGRNLGNPPFTTREGLPKIRKQELQEAAKAMGISDLRMMGLRDKTIEFEDEEKLIGMITDAVHELNPSLVISFYPGYSVHPDHDATGKAVVEALGRMPEESRPTLHAVAFSSNCIEDLGEPDIVNEVSAFQATKLAALRAHASQTQLMTADWEEKINQRDPEVLRRLNIETFWTYKWDNK